MSRFETGTFEEFIAELEADDIKRPRWYRLLRDATNRLLRMLEDVPSNIEWAWQRVFRGWDDRVIWSVDEYLADHMPTWIEEVKKRSMGAPVVFFEESDFDPNNNYSTTEEGDRRAWKKYFETLDAISDGFKAIKERYDHSDKWYEFQPRIDAAMKLFAEYHHTLDD